MYMPMHMVKGKKVGRHDELNTNETNIIKIKERKGWHEKHDAWTDISTILWSMILSSHSKKKAIYGIAKA